MGDTRSGLLVYGGVGSREMVLVLRSDSCFVSQDEARITVPSYCLIMK